MNQVNAFSSNLIAISPPPPISVRRYGVSALAGYMIYILLLQLYRIKRCSKLKEKKKPEFFNSCRKWQTAVHLLMSEPKLPHQVPTLVWRKKGLEAEAGKENDTTFGRKRFK